jgi:thioredoxin-dependent peroxiredoxin
VSVVGVSADKPATSERFCRELDLPYPMVGDAEGAILKAYQVRWPVIGLARRVTYVIGRDRKIRLAYRSERDVEGHVDKAVAEALRAADTPRA